MHVSHAFYLVNTKGKSKQSSSTSLRAQVINEIALKTEPKPVAQGTYESGWSLLQTKHCNVQALLRKLYIYIGKFMQLWGMVSLFLWFNGFYNRNSKCNLLLPLPKILLVSEKLLIFLTIFHSLKLHYTEDASSWRMLSSQTCICHSVSSAFSVA